MAVYKPSLADAKILKNVPQYFICCDLPGDFPEVVEAFTDVLGDKFTAEMDVETEDDTFDGGTSVR